MSYRYGEREQMELFPPSIEEYISPQDPVRVYDAFVEYLDFQDLGIELDPNKIGNPAYDPKTMLKLLVWGYSYGIRSSRKLERAVYHNVSFMWLMGGMKPDHKTIANFRTENKLALKKVLKQCARLCLKLGLIEGNTLFVDGTRIRANASIKRSYTKEQYEKYLKELDERIEHILSESERIDQEEQDQESLVKLSQELQNREVLRERVKELLQGFEQEYAPKTINATDPDCNRMHSIQGTHASYNVQSVVDEKHGLIVHVDAVSDNHDIYQLSNQINQANTILETPAKRACADSGYADVEQLQHLAEQGIELIVPSQRQASEKKPKPFDKSAFRYDAKDNCYICPEGQRLTYHGFEVGKHRFVYRMPNASTCLSCKHFGVCTSSERGRKVSRSLYEESALRFEEHYQKPQSQAIYKLRKSKVELPFGHIKRNLGVNAFLLRGLEAVRAETSLLATCFNLSRLINLIGIQQLIQGLGRLRMPKEVLALSG
jgi:transposase